MSRLPATAVLIPQSLLPPFLGLRVTSTDTRVTQRFEITLPPTAALQRGTQIPQHLGDESPKVCGLWRGELPGGTNQVNGIVATCRFHLPHDPAYMILHGELR